MTEKEKKYARIWTPADLWSRVKSQAALEGENVAEYAGELLEEAIDREELENGKRVK